MTPSQTSDTPIYTTFSHEETRTKIWQAHDSLQKLTLKLLGIPEVVEEIERVNKLLIALTDSETQHYLNEIQNQPIAEWKP